MQWRQANYLVEIFLVQQTKFWSYVIHSHAILVPPQVRPYYDIAQQMRRIVVR